MIAGSRARASPPRSRRCRPAAPGEHHRAAGFRAHRADQRIVPARRARHAPPAAPPSVGQVARRTAPKYSVRLLPLRRPPAQRHPVQILLQQHLLRDMGVEPIAQSALPSFPGRSRNRPQQPAPAALGIVRRRYDPPRPKFRHQRPPARAGPRRDGHRSGGPPRPRRHQQGRDPSRTAGSIAGAIRIRCGSCGAAPGPVPQPERRRRRLREQRVRHRSATQGGDRGRTVSTAMAAHPTPVSFSRDLAFTVNPRHRSVRTPPDCTSPERRRAGARRPRACRPGDVVRT